MAAPRSTLREPSPAAAGEAPSATGTCGAPVDFAFLAEQTFNDAVLERDVLDLFLDQARRLLPRMAGMAARERGETAHLLKGSCQGIGARTAAAAAQAVEDAPARPDLLDGLRAAFAAVEAAIVARFASP